MGLQSSRRRAGALTVAPLTTALGAEISGVDLAVPLTDVVIAEIRTAPLAIFSSIPISTPATMTRRW